MGRDKGLIPIPDGGGEGNFAARVRDLLLPHCDGVRISIRPAQLPEYSARFPAAGLLVDEAEIISCVKGPLAGILSAALFFPDRDIFFLPCDMPSLHPSIIKRIARCHRRKSDRDASLAYHGGIEPLIGIYGRALLKSLRDRYAGGGEGDFSLLSALRGFEITPVEASRDELMRMKNYNTPADLRGAGSLY
jgi:molybdopterin-guanine dinucleotide biosynthesis protein A